MRAYTHECARVCVCIQSPFPDKNEGIIIKLFNIKMKERALAEFQIQKQ